MRIDWENSESHLLLNPSYSTEDRAKFQQILQVGSHFKGHIWLSTSGSSSPKWVGLSKKALLSSAEAVNRHLESGSQDVWILSLPLFHVGGLGIAARAYLSQAQLHDFRAANPGKWNPEIFYRFLVEMKGTLTSLVPTQLQDLVDLEKKTPPSLRSVVIGGGFTSKALYEKAIGLGWPILPSYGMTECSSQIATAPLHSWKKGIYPPLLLLPHLQCSAQEGHLSFAGPSLLTAYALFENDRIILQDPKINGWLKTNDQGIIDNGVITFFGRGDSLIKIGGENVDLAKLENHLQELKTQLKLSYDVTLIALEDQRLGRALHLASDSPAEEALTPLIEAYQNSVLPFEKIRKVHLFSELPRSSIGKILRNALESQIKR